MFKIDNSFNDITVEKNKKILKKTVDYGEDEDFPKLGDKVFCQIKLITITNNEEILISTTEKDSYINFNLFFDEVIIGLSIAVSSMRRKEKSFFVIHPDYVCGSDQIDSLPKKKPLHFEITLFDWDNENLTKKDDAGVTRIILEKGEGYETPVENCMVTINLIGFLPNKEVFDERKMITFKLSEGCEVSIPKGLELALYKMKKKEINRIFVKKNYLYNDDCLPPRKSLELNFDYLIFVIELISFESKKQIFELKIKERVNECEFEKNEAAKFLKKNKFNLALKHYCQILKLIGPPDTFDYEGSIELQDKRFNYLLSTYSNLCLCYLKTKKLKECVKYANLVLDIDSKNLKAYYRRGLAFFEINEFNKARNDFEMCLQIDPCNKAAQHHLTLLDEQVKNYQNKQRKIFSNLFEAFAKDEQIK